MKHRWVIGLASLLGLISTPVLQAIECHELELVTEKMLQEHYIHRAYDDALCQRILDQVLLELDPGKLIFEQSDVTELKEAFGNDIDIWLFARSCMFLDAIQERYYERTAQRYQQVAPLIDTPHDFTADESYLRAQHRDYLDDPDALTNRWRKQIKYQILQSRLTGLEPATIQGKLHRYYRDRFTSDDRLPGAKLRDHFLIAFSKSLDPHTKYYPPANAADIRIALGEAFFGIGATIEFRNESFFIARLNPGGPAFQGKQLRQGDQILAVTNAEGEPVEAFGKTLTELVHLIRGPKDSRVELTIHRRTADGSVVKKIPIVRDRIDPVAAAAETKSFQVHSQADGKSEIRIGLISLSSFYLDREAQLAHDSNYRSASKDLAKLIETLQEQPLDSLVLDLRGNGGGILAEAVAVTGLFIDAGPVVQKRDAYGDVVVLRDKNKRIAYEGPLTVIIEPASASASEIVAGALQDYRRALVVGSGNTFGKGTVQIVSEVERKRAELGTYKLTNALYFLPSGRTPQLNGIEPDIRLPQQSQTVRTMSDKPFAIPPTVLEPTEFNRPDTPDHHRAPLQARSEARMKEHSKGNRSHPERTNTESVNLQEAFYQDNLNAEEASNTPDAILNEALRITFDRYRMLNHLPLDNAPIEIKEH